MLVMKLCPVCGKAFEKTGNRQICCSKACADKRHGAQRLAHDRAVRAAQAERAKCAFCGKEFVKNQKNQKFCCIKCKDDHENAARRAHHAAHPTIRKCVVCGKEFVVLHGTKAVCSEECKRIHVREVDRAYRAKHAEHRFCKCLGCGKVFQVVGHWYRYCPECRAKGFGSSGSGGANGTEYGLTEAQMREVIYDQDTRPFEERYEASLKWTPKQRKFARARYEKRFLSHAVYRMN